MTAYYKQNVYDNDNNKIGQIVDVLIGKDGKIDNFVVGAGGFLGMGKHDVMVPFSSVKMVKEDATPRNDPKAKNRDRDRGDREARNNYRLVMNTTKDQLKSSPAVKYDRTAMTWVQRRQFEFQQHDRPPHHALKRRDRFRLSVREGPPGFDPAGL